VKEAPIRQEFFELFETDANGDDINLKGYPNTKGAPTDQFASDVEKTAVWRFEGTIYFVPHTHSEFLTIRAMFNTGTVGVPEGITMPTALTVPNNLGPAVGHRVLEFYYHHSHIPNERRATLTVSHGSCRASPHTVEIPRNTEERQHNDPPPPPPPPPPDDVEWDDFQSASRPNSVAP
jgi:hypothetical protein